MSKVTVRIDLGEAAPMEHRILNAEVHYADGVPWDMLVLELPHLLRDAIDELLTPHVIASDP